MVSFAKEHMLNKKRDKGIKANDDDVLGNETHNAPDFHSEMESRLKMNW